MFKNSKTHYDSKTNKTDSVIYFNANIYNDPLGSQKATLARFNQSISSGSIVDLPENYYLAIVRFAISHALIPLYQFKNNFYSVTVGNTQTFLNYKDVGNYSSYGFSNPVFYYNQFTFMINSALRTSFIAEGIVSEDYSYITYDEVLEKFVIYYKADQSYNIYFNANLFQQLQFFGCVFNGYNSTLGKDYQLDLELCIRKSPTGVNAAEVTSLPPPPPVTTQYLLAYQERKALYLLNEVQSIVFTSTTLNVTKEYTGKNDGSGNAGSIAILADFVPDQSTGRDLSEFQYNVQGPPRLVNLTNTIPITEIDYQVGIRFRDGTIVPLYLEPGETCEVKFGFFKKSLYDNNFEY